jgi:hypothetical protein
MPTLEHDSLDDKTAGKALVHPRAHKMIEEPPLRKSQQVRLLQRELEKEQRGSLPHLHVENPEIWDGEIE